METTYNEFYCAIAWGNSVRNAKRPTGPCVIYNSGAVYFATNRTSVSRSNGPSVVCKNGAIDYFVDGLRSRTDGPAVIKEDGIKQYWVKGEQMSEIEFFLKYGVM